MTKSEEFLFEFENELESTKKLISCIPEDQWNWKPHAKSMMLGDLAKHIVELSLWTKSIMNDSSFDLQTQYKPLSLTSKKELLSLLDNYGKEVKALLKEKSDFDWSKTWELRSGDHVIMNVPKFSANRFVVNNHIYHHRGQLSVYLRLLDIPIPGMYGPSADQV
ncbi:DinB family protein [Myroides sp. LJL115]